MFFFVAGIRAHEKLYEYIRNVYPELFNGSVTRKPENGQVIKSLGQELNTHTKDINYNISCLAQGSAVEQSIIEKYSTAEYYLHLVTLKRRAEEQNRAHEEEMRKIDANARTRSKGR